MKAIKLSLSLLITLIVFSPWIYVFVLTISMEPSHFPFLSGCSIGLLLFYTAYACTLPLRKFNKWFNSKLK